MNKHFYLIVDTETTQKNTVADFGAVIVDRQGEIHEQFGVLLHGHFGTLPLFSDRKAPTDAFFSIASRERRRKNYDAMLENGQRSICAPALVNLWLARVLGQYNPTLTAYNLSFDFGKCRNTGIDLGIFSTRFCLMRAAHNTICRSADYEYFCGQNSLITPTGRIRRTADAVAKFLSRDANGNTSLQDEPHTALEDARDYEAAILAEILRTHSRNSLLQVAE